MRTCSLLALTACVALVTAHYSPTLAAQRDHQGFRALPKIQSHPDRDASTHRGKGRRRWHSDHHHHAKHVKAVAAHYSLFLAAQRNHRGFRALAKIQSHAGRDASTHRGKGRRRWHSDHHHHAKHVKAVAAHYSLSHRGKGRRRWHSDYHHHAKHVKAVLKTPYGGQHPNEVKKQIDVVQQQVFETWATAPEKPIQLKQAPGRDKVEAHCGACHSLDYVIMNSPFLNASGWDAEVAKMINAFGAPIDQSDAEIIADYLKRNYGM